MKKSLIIPIIGLVILGVSAFFFFDKNEERGNKNLALPSSLFNTADFYEMKTLKDFVSHKQSPGEAKYKLEQLRALENKIKINVALAKSHSIGIDTKQDFVAIKKIMEYKT